MASERNDPLNIANPHDLRKCREKALKLSKWGDVKGLIPVYVKPGLVVFRKPDKVKSNLQTGS